MQKNTEKNSRSFEDNHSTSEQMKNKLTSISNPLRECLQKEATNPSMYTFKRKYYPLHSIFQSSRNI